MYRSAMGKPVDMGALLTKNEKVRAVGNMSVNARGDKLTPTNKINQTKAHEVNRRYRKQIRNQIKDVPVGNPIHNTSDKPKIEGFDIPLKTEQVQDQEAEAKTEVTKNTTSTKGGLASAIAKAREVEQKKLQTPREKSRSKKGVKKI